MQRFSTVAFYSTRYVFMLKHKNSTFVSYASLLFHKKMPPFVLAKKSSIVELEAVLS